MSDTIVEEIRRVRDDYARRFNYDLHAMCAELRREQERAGGPVVSLPRRAVQASPASEALPAGAELSPGSSD